jgi:hypothetical protein
MRPEVDPTERPCDDGGTGADAARPDPTGGPSPAPNVADTMAGVSQHLRELMEYISYYLSAKTDGLKHSLVRLGLFAALALVGLLAATAVVVTAAVLACLGISEGIDRLVNSRWIADMVTGVVILGVIGGGGYAAIQILSRSWSRKTRAKYEARRQEQRRRFGHDITDRAESFKK